MIARTTMACRWERWMTIPASSRNFTSTWPTKRLGTPSPMISRSCPAPRSSSAMPPIIGRSDGSLSLGGWPIIRIANTKSLLTSCSAAHRYGANCKSMADARGRSGPYARRRRYELVDRVQPLNLGGSLIMARYPLRCVGSSGKFVQSRPVLTPGKTNAVFTER